MSELKLLKLTLKPDAKSGWLRWCEELEKRTPEVVETMRSEGMLLEAAFLSKDGESVYYVVEANNLEKARAAARNSPYPIDREHRQVFWSSFGEIEPLEALLYFRNEATSRASGAITTQKIETPRLMLSPPNPDDAARLLAYLQRNESHLRPWLPKLNPQHFTIDYWNEKIQAALRGMEEGTYASFLIFDRTELDGPVLGRCELSQIARGPFQAAYLGYDLDSAHCGRGLMHEALTAVIGYAFQELKLHRLMANYIASNERSGRVLRRLGFTVEGHARDYLRINGQWEDHVLTSLINSSWTDINSP
jgi:[ribosomal protein S5]-alanine N-acetyltransferase